MISDEEKLLNDFQNGNNKAYEKLFHLYKNQTYNFAYKMLGDRDSAADVAQEVFIRLYKMQGNSNRINCVKNWLFILTRNLCLNWIRDHRREMNFEQITETTSQNETLPHGQIYCLQRALRMLDLDLREALILRAYQGFSYQEISEILGISVSAVKSLLFRARVRLREIFEKIKGGDQLAVF